MANKREIRQAATFEVAKEWAAADEKYLWSEAFLYHHDLLRYYGEDFDRNDEECTRGVEYFEERCIEHLDAAGIPW